MIIDIYNHLIKKRELTLLYLLSAIVATYFASWFPDFENLIGIEGARISSVVSFGALNGFLLGPLWGAIASFTGIMAHVFVRSHTPDMFHLLTPFFVAMASVVTGLCITKREKAAMILFSILILGWYITPLGREVFYYPWFHIIVLGSFVLFHHKYHDKRGNFYTFAFLLFSTLIAILADHLAGSITAAILYDITPQMFTSVIAIYPIERITLAFAAAAIVYLLIIALQSTLMESETFQNKIEEAKRNELLSYIDNVKDIINKDNNK
ncbi:hypothetical protein [Methanococcoides burtonii]|uniref:Uncharacterized protein n=1 Tax=Methanococcoides burtonii (strain DSM 6242 / NBRC 107633 / OCM 468 / ACE-M) TaxID=259564 RepID=Q12UK4_METBU|nr:hypothetical protein [Methanococcoides burtonii]ABE52872.1 Hypothetical protein Mbur_1993 [Methanococcoides burtonii DSM 6242]